MSSPLTVNNPAEVMLVLRKHGATHAARVRDDAASPWRSGNRAAARLEAALEAGRSFGGSLSAAQIKHLVSPRKQWRRRRLLVTSAERPAGRTDDRLSPLLLFHDHCGDFSRTAGQSGGY